MKISSLITLLGIPFIFVACSSSKTQIDFDKPPAQVIKPQPVVNYNKGSLYSRKGPSLFADKKDLQVGEIIQVIINETLSAESESTRELTNDRRDALGGGLVIPTAGNPENVNKYVEKAANIANQVGGVQFNSTSSSSFTGDTSNEHDESFSTTISVIIEETYANGNYYIKGSKEMLIDRQKQEIVISGLIRPFDITPENTINSAQIANLKVMYVKDGEEQDVMRVPWGTRLLKQIWPF